VTNRRSINSWGSRPMEIIYLCN